MARNNRGTPRYDPIALAQQQPSEQDLLVPVSCFDFKGMDATAPLNLMQPGVARLVRDLNFRDGAYLTRDGTSVIGSAAASDLVYALDVTLQDGTSYTLRVRVDGVDYLVGSGWVAATGDVFNATQGSPFPFTGWGDTLIIAGTGKARTVSFDPVVLTEIPESPDNIIHLTTFGSRVIASLSDGKVQWTIKDDSTDWTGLGSGFEDLRSAPGGRPDAQAAVIPVTDEVAYCIRTNSIWQMSLTGNFDAPFNFSRLFSHIGTSYPQTAVAIPQGVIFLADAQIWLVTPQGYREIGEPIKSYINASAVTLGKATATYDVLFKEYKLAIGDKVFRFNLTGGFWTQDSYKFPIRSIAYTLFANSLTIDQLEGTIDSLVGTIDQLGVNRKDPGTIYAMDNSYRYVVRDDPTRNDEDSRDVDNSGDAVSGGFRLETGDIFIRDDGKRKDVVELVLAYESSEDVTLTFEYTYDGKTWAFMTQKVAPATTRPGYLKVSRYADRPFFQFAVSAAAAPTVRLISLNAMIREGARIVDAN